MNHHKRGRVKVAIGEGWRAYSPIIPGMEMLGIVEQGGVIGALVQDSFSGEYYRAINGDLMPMKKQKIDAALVAGSTCTNHIS